MKMHDRELACIARLKPLAMRGDGLAISNIAAGYRILGKPVLAFRWWKRGAEAGDGSDMLEMAYCLQHGAGVRKNVVVAARAYALAIAYKYMSAYDEEEARYHLAVLLVENRPLTKVRARVDRLLAEANRDGDYPQALQLSAMIASGAEITPCACRRFLRPTLRRRYCRLHRRA